MKNLKLIIIIILAGFNIFLLLLNSQQQNRIMALNDQLEATDLEKLVSRHFKISNPKIKESKSSLSLIVFIPQQSCISCLSYELRNLNSFYKKNMKYTMVYFIGKDTSFFQRFNVTFPTVTLNPKEQIVHTEFNFNNPTAMLIDSNRSVRQIYLAEVGNETKSNQFYQRMNSLFKSVE